ncbi:eIF-2-alpha kinase GCN2 [Parasteatoda tepidariorum]|uniref:eIF-2-alpha kinase GCN2 n=1 Tax=Parasteatoda tepidariorum TaxID=114398 RepID=UPI001C72165B|nr:eIF-2-alpha kinase GCN2 [Parasteatoda tepidariorum]
MDMTTYVPNSSNDKKHEKSKESTEDTGSEKCLQSNCKDMLNSKLKFFGKEEHNIVIGKCFRHGQRGCIVYKGLDTNSGNLVAVVKWVFPLCSSNLTDKRENLKMYKANYLRQITAIEQESKNLRLMKFNNLVHYLGMQHTLKKDKIIVYVLQELVCGINLQQILQNIPVTISCLQLYARKILEALQCLHKNGIVHQNLRLSSVFIDSSGSVKLADYCLDKKLEALSGTLSKDVVNDCLSSSPKYNSKDDIYNFGILLLTLFIGHLKNEYPIIIPDNVNLVLKEFLNKCFISDEKVRWSAEQLLSHPFLSNPASNIDLFRDKVDNENKPDCLENSLRPYSNHSRLTTEFDILKSLGKGGFGHVWKVQNKLDSRVYALKRIPLDPNNKQLNYKIKREVTLLSRLSHENIVRYYNSWIETTPDVQCLQNNAISVSKKCETKSKQSFSQSYSSVCWDIHDSQLSSDEEDFDNNNDSVIFLNEKECGEKSLNISHTKRITTNVQSIVSNKDSSIRMRHYMYIQMEFCENSTLRTAIDTSLYRDIPRLWRLFKEIVEGLHYIHQQGIIHRDLKPVNIFLDSNDRVKIGDFGLATDIISKAVGSEISLNELKYESCSSTYVSHTGGVGTAFYVAPELACSDKVPYDQKVDIYSLGIILFEMCFPPPVTFMERSIILTDLRKRDIILPDTAYELLSDDMIHLLIWLLQHDVTKRPTSEELITSKYISTLTMAKSDSIILYSSFIAITSEINEEPHET